MAKTRPLDLEITSIKVRLLKDLNFRLKELPKLIPLQEKRLWPLDLGNTSRKVLLLSIDLLLLKLVPVQDLTSSSQETHQVLEIILQELEKRLDLLMDLELPKDLKWLKKMNLDLEIIIFLLPLLMYLSMLKIILWEKIDHFLFSFFFLYKLYIIIH